MRFVAGVGQASLTLQRRQQYAPPQNSAVVVVRPRACEGRRRIRRSRIVLLLVTGSVVTGTGPL